MVANYSPSHNTNNKNSISTDIITIPKSGFNSQNDKHYSLKTAKTVVITTPEPMEIVPDLDIDNKSVNSVKSNKTLSDTSINDESK